MTSALFSSLTDGLSPVHIKNNVKRNQGIFEQLSTIRKSTNQVISLHYTATTKTLVFVRLLSFFCRYKYEDLM